MVRYNKFADTWGTKKLSLYALELENAIDKDVMFGDFGNATGAEAAFVLKDRIDEAVEKATRQAQSRYGNKYGAGNQLDSGRVILKPSEKLKGGFSLRWEGDYTNFIEFGAGLYPEFEGIEAQGGLNNPFLHYTSYQPEYTPTASDIDDRWVVRLDGNDEAEKNEYSTDRYDYFVRTRGWEGYNPFFNTFYDLWRSDEFKFQYRTFALRSVRGFVDTHWR